MPIDHSRITDANGRHIPVTRRRLADAKPDSDSDAPGKSRAANSAPRNGRELGDRLDNLVGQMDRLRPESHNPERYFERRSEIRRELARLAEWAHRQKD